MANKYQVEKIRRIIVERLESDWPQSLTDWRRLEAEIEVMESGAWALAEDPQTMTYLHVDRHLPEPASAIRLAHECDIPSILPAAYYQLSWLTVEHDTDLAGKDRTLFVMTHGLEQRTAQWSLLEKEDLMRVLRGKVKLQQRYPSSRLQCCLSTFLEREMTKDQLCFMHLERDEGAFIKYLWDKMEKASTSDILKGYQSILKEIDQKTPVCSTCSRRAELRFDCQEIWDNLPSIFGIE